MPEGKGRDTEVVEGDVGVEEGEEAADETGPAMEVESAIARVCFMCEKI